MTDLKILKDLSKTNRYTGTRRFDSFKIKTKDGIFYYKKALGENEKVCLENEVRFCRKFKGATDSFLTPEVVSYKDDIAIFEWVDAPQLIDDGRFERLTARQFDRITDVLVSLDSFRGIQYVGGSPYTRHADSLTKKLQEKLDRIVSEGLITAEDGRKAARTIKEYSKYITPAFQHGDMAPQHIFDTNPVTLHDAEHASQNMCRFDDLSVIAARLYRAVDDKKQVFALTDEVRGGIGLSAEAFAQQTTSISLVHAVNLLNDSLNDLVDVDYRDDAKDYFAHLQSAGF